MTFVIWTTVEVGIGREPSCLFWRAAGAGYTSDLSKAGRYTIEDVLSRGFSPSPPSGGLGLRMEDGKVAGFVIYVHWRDRSTGLVDVAIPDHIAEAHGVPEITVPLGKLPAPAGAKVGCWSW